MSLQIQASFAIQGSRRLDYSCKYFRVSNFYRQDRMKLRKLYKPDLSSLGQKHLRFVTES